MKLEEERKRPKKYNTTRRLQSANKKHKATDL